MEAQRLPQIGVVHNRHIFTGPAISKTIPHNAVACMPGLVAATFQINLAIDDAISNIKIGLKRAIGIQDAAAARKLDTALLAIAISCNDIDAILEGPGHPPMGGTMLLIPICRKEHDVSS